MIAYHFTTDTLRNGEPLPPIGEWLEHKGAVIPCSQGLHASEHPFDALKYAPGNLLHMVELEGDLISHGFPTDKWVGRRRKILKTIDATGVIQTFARLCAFSVIHLWDAPEIVIEFLTTGNTDLAHDVAVAAARAAVAVDAAAAAVHAVDADGAAAARAAARAVADAAAARDTITKHRQDFLSLVESEF